MENRIKDLEIEVAYLRKAIEDLIELIENGDIDNHFHLTNIFYSKDYLDNLNEK
jgi:hypothetical protein